MPERADNDNEQTWPPRFAPAFIGWSAVVLLGLFLLIAGWFRAVYDAAGLFDGATAERHAAAFALLVIGLLLLLGGVLFSLIEAKSPPPSSVPTATTTITTSAAVTTTETTAINVGDALSGVVGAIAGHKRSTVLFSLGIFLCTLAAAGSGLVDVSLGDPQDPTQPTTTTTSDGD